MDKYYAVIDTNVIVSAFMKPTNSITDANNEQPLPYEGVLTAPFQILRHVWCKKIVPVISTEIIAEYRDVLSRDKFKIQKEDISRFLADFIECAVFVSPVIQDATLPDPKDVVFYEITMGAREKQDTYLITGNIKHFPIETFIVTPRQMLEIMNEGNNNNLGKKNMNSKDS